MAVEVEALEDRGKGGGTPDSEAFGAAGGGVAGGGVGGGRGMRFELSGLGNVRGGGRWAFALALLAVAFSVADSDIDIPGVLWLRSFAGGDMIDISAVLLIVFGEIAESNLSVSCALRRTLFKFSGVFGSQSGPSTPLIG